jgi:glycosyltransferase involved in cell wall biosynthesis
VRILLISDTWRPQVNGVVRTLTTLESELARQGHVPRFIIPAGRPSIPIPGYKELRMAFIRPTEVGREIDAFEPDAVHIATEGPMGLAARSWCLRKNLDFTTGFHTRYPEFAEAMYGIPGIRQSLYAGLRWFHRPSRGIMVPTPSVAATLRQRGFENLRVWNRGVDIELFRPGPKDAVKLPRPVFVCAGRIAAEKGLEDFLALKLPGSKVVIGDGPLLERLRSEHPDVHFTGYLFNGAYAQMLGAADVFVFPSRNDTFGLVMLEALACGVPVAAYPVPSPVDVIEDGVCGCLDDDLERAAMRALEIDPAACRRYAEARPWSAVARRFLELIVPCGRAMSSSCGL